MKKLISILAVMIAALLFSACGQDPVAELETQIAKEDNPNRRELFAEFAQIFRRERAKQPFDATRGLALAVVFDYPDYAEFFLERGADVNGTCMDGAPMLGFAAEQHFSEICRLLVKRGADVDSRSQDGKTPLMHALNNTDYDSTSSVRLLSGKSVDGKAERKKVAEFLFEKGADVNARSKDGFSVLFYAVIQQDAEMARWLIGKGADVRVMTHVGDAKVSLVQYAALGGRESLPVLETLLSAGADPNAGADSGFENSALRFALDKANGGDFSCAEALIRHGADVNTPSLLNFYVAQENVPVVKFLLKHGANPNAEGSAKYDENGGRRTALFDAAGRKNLELVKLLTDAGADVNKPAVVADRGGDDRLAMPVMSACLDTPEIVRYLLERGADPNAVVIRGQTLLSWAVHDENLETVKLLLDAGANPDAEVEPEGAPGETIPAIVFAADRGNRALFLLLKEKGAKLPDLVPVPVAVVKIPGKSYAFGKYEVTQAQYASVMGANPSVFKGENLPVERVSWNDAVRFCEKLTAWERALGLISENQEYRLPTSDEWEHACRAGTATRFYTGDAESDLDRAGWYDGNSGSKTHPVGQKEPNAFGLYDMHGNVWEWTATAEGSGRVYRGGSWYYFADFCESSSGGSYSSPDYRDYDLGFRVVLAPAE